MAQRPSDRPTDPTPLYRPGSLADAVKAAYHRQFTQTHRDRPTALYPACDPRTLDLDQDTIQPLSEFRAEAAAILQRAVAAQTGVAPIQPGDDPRTDAAKIDQMRADRAAWCVAPIEPAAGLADFDPQPTLDALEILRKARLQCLDLPSAWNKLHHAATHLDRQIADYLGGK